VLKSLVARGVGHVIVANRSMERAVALADCYQGEPVVLNDLPRYLARADVVISSTGAEHRVLTEALLKEALRERGQSPILIIDIAIPRDVDPQVGQLDNVYLFDMKSLDVLAEANREARREEEARCVSLVETSADQFCAWQEGLVAEPTLMSLSARLHAIREEELARALNRLPDLDDNARAEIDYLTKRIVNKILQTPMAGVKEEIQHHDPGTVLHLVKRMFGIREG